MIYSELNNVIAHCCPEYEPFSHTIGMSMRAVSESCSNCSNFIKEKCIKNLHDDIGEKIKIN